MCNDKFPLNLFTTFVTMNKELNALYHRRVGELSELITALQSKSKGFVIGEIVSFVSALGFLVLFTIVENGSWTLLVALLLLFLYFYIRHLDAKNDRKISEESALKLVYEREIDYQTGDYSKFDAGERYVKPSHHFTLRP